MSVSDLRANLRDVVARAKTGEDVIVTERGLPVVRISAIDQPPILERLIAEGVIEAPADPTRRVDPSEWTDLPKLDPPLSDDIIGERERKR